MEDEIHSASDTSSEEEEEEDEDGRAWSEKTEKDFLKTLCCLKKKDPKIYNDNVYFFETNNLEEEEICVPKGGKKKKDSLYLRDYERKIILEKGGILTDDESGDNNSESGRQSPTYIQEQNALKENFKKMLNEDNNEYNSDDYAGFLTVKTKTDNEKVKDEEDYVEWLKGQRNELSDKRTKEELKFLRDYWIDPNLNEGEQFLRDYILNKRYLESDDESKMGKDELEFSEEEQMLEEHDEYEEKYNYRYEEPDAEFTKTYPRVIENSLRRKNEKRKLKRDVLKKKKQDLFKQKQVEVKQLKKLKKQELLKKIEKIKTLTGNDQLGFNDFDIKGDFNPNEYDKKMAELFNEEFYSLEDDTKPQFSDSDYSDVNICDDTNNGIDECNNDNENYEIDNEDGPVENDNFIVDCDYDPTTAKESKFKKQTRSSRKKGHKLSKLTEAVRKEKPIFNPADKTFQQYVDEYYGLEFEDIVGGMPCRFQYRKVIPNSYGLTIEEILAAEDKELDKWCSMKKIQTIQPDNIEKFDVKIYSRKGKDLELKRKILPSIFNDEVESAVDKPPEKSLQKKKKKTRKEKQNVSPRVNNKNRPASASKEYNKTNDAFIHRTSTNLVNNNIDTITKTKKGIGLCTNKKKKTELECVMDDHNTNLEGGTNNNISTKDRTKFTKNKKKLFNKTHNNLQHSKKFNNSTNYSDEKSVISDERLKAYGINPKHYKNKLKYAPK